TWHPSTPRSSWTRSSPADKGRDNPTTRAAVDPTAASSCLPHTGGSSGPLPDTGSRGPPTNTSGHVAYFLFGTLFGRCGGHGRSKSVGARPREARARAGLAPKSASGKNPEPCTCVPWKGRWVAVRGSLVPHAPPILTRIRTVPR